MAIELTLEKVIDLAKEAVASKPEGYIYINPEGQMARKDRNVSCSYWDDEKDAPSCIVGTIVHAAGVGKFHISSYQGYFAAGWLHVLEGQDVITLDDATERFLMHLQNEQDTGNTWAKALEVALEVALERALSKV